MPKTFADEKPEYRCPECGLLYPTEELAERCRKWCSKHKSCNLEIIQHAIKDEHDNHR